MIASKHVDRLLEATEVDLRLQVTDPLVVEGFAPPHPLEELHRQEDMAADRVQETAI